MRLVEELHAIRNRWFPTPEDEAETERIAEQAAQDVAAWRDVATSRGGLLLRAWIERQIIESDEREPTDHAQMLVNTGVRCGLRKVLKHIEAAGRKEM